MNIDLLVRECGLLAEAYCLASEARGRAEALSPEDEPGARRALDAAFVRLLAATSGLADRGLGGRANAILLGALHDAARRGRAALSAALANLKGVA